MKHWVIYTDGSCVPNPGPGGWGAVLTCGQNRIELFGASDGLTTNNRMEIMGAIAALRTLTEPSDVDMWTDSAYLRNGGLIWCKRWAALGWEHGRKHKRNPIPNVDLWKQLFEAMDGHTVRWHWLLGHNGNEANERCDELAARWKPAKNHD